MGVLSGRLSIQMVERLGVQMRKYRARSVLYSILLLPILGCLSCFLFWVIINGIPHTKTIGDSTLSGLVIEDGSGLPIAGAFVCASFYDAGGFFAARKKLLQGCASTGEDGKFTIPPVRFESIATGTSYDADETPNFAVLHPEYDSYITSREQADQFSFSLGQRDSNPSYIYAEPLPNFCDLAGRTECIEACKYYHGSVDRCGLPSDLRSQLHLN